MGFSGFPENINRIFRYDIEIGKLASCLRNSNFDLNPISDGKSPKLF